MYHFPLKPFPFIFPLDEALIKEHTSVKDCSLLDFHHALKKRSFTLHTLAQECEHMKQLETIPDSLPVHPNSQICRFSHYQTRLSHCRNSWITANCLKISHACHVQGNSCCNIPAPGFVSLAFAGFVVCLGRRRRLQHCHQLRSKSGCRKQKHSFKVICIRHL